LNRRETPLDAAQLLSALGRHEVEYVLIGGLAVQAHGHVRTTQDVDLFPNSDAANLKRLASALRELGARPSGARGTRAPNTTELARGGTHVLETDVGGLDLHFEPPGARAWDQMRSRALVLEVSGTTVPVAGLDDLIAMKRARGQPIDRGDVIALTEPG
jgi:hypothetical protein